MGFQIVKCHNYNANHPRARECLHPPGAAPAASDTLLAGPCSRVCARRGPARGTSAGWTGREGA
eukprot:5663592-Pyramimonas_sp.AAC.1